MSTGRLLLVWVAIAAVNFIMLHLSLQNIESMKVDAVTLGCAYYKADGTFEWGKPVTGETQ